MWTPARRSPRSGPANPEVLAPGGRGEEARLRGSLRYNGDPNFVKVPLERMLSKQHAQSLCGQVDPDRARDPMPPAPPTAMATRSSCRPRTAGATWWPGSTAFSSFGSGITVPGYGFMLHNRGGLFTLDPESPNAIAPHKRPFNTLSAAFVMQNNRPLMTVTLMGGDMQAQGIAQVLGQHARSRRQRAGRDRHGALPPQSDAERAGAGIGALRAGRRPAEGDGPQGRVDRRRTVGGYQAILFTPDHAPGARWRAAADQGLLSRRLGSSQGRPGCRVLMSQRTDAWPDLPSGRVAGYLRHAASLDADRRQNRVAQCPWVNHSWHVTLHVTAKGLTTLPIPYGDRTFQIDFDFAHHLLTVQSSDGRIGHFKLEPQSVATFYGRLMEQMAKLDLHGRSTGSPMKLPMRSPSITTRPTPHTIASTPIDTGGSSCRPTACSRISRSFHGQCSPVHYFWGAPDLAVTRFSGRPAPEHPGGIPNLPER